MSCKLLVPSLGALLLATSLAAAEPGEIPTSPQGVRPLLIGSQAPGGILPDANGQDFDLGQALDARSTILVFYRAHW